MVFENLPADPMELFLEWQAEVLRSGPRPGLAHPDAVVLATVSDAGQPSARIVLMKDIAEQGFVFYTNLQSVKARELADNPRCALVFAWHDYGKQVRVSGSAQLLDRDRVTTYFASRPRASQLAAHASRQSQEISGREELDAAYAEVEARYKGTDVPVPEHWGGFEVFTQRFEFWVDGPGRLHERVVYEQVAGKQVDGAAQWHTRRLAP